MKQPEPSSPRAATLALVTVVTPLTLFMSPVHAELRHCTCDDVRHVETLLAQVESAQARYQKLAEDLQAGKVTVKSHPTADPRLKNLTEEQIARNPKEFSGEADALVAYVEYWRQTQLTVGWPARERVDGPQHRSPREVSDIERGALRIPSPEPTASSNEAIELGIDGECKLIQAHVDAMRRTMQCKQMMDSVLVHEKVGHGSLCRAAHGWRLETDPSVDTDLLRGEKEPWERPSHVAKDEVRAHAYQADFLRKLRDHLQTRAMLIVTSEMVMRVPELGKWIYSREAQIPIVESMEGMGPMSVKARSLSGCTPEVQNIDYSWYSSVKRERDRLLIRIYAKRKEDYELREFGSTCIRNGFPITLPAPGAFLVHAPAMSGTGESITLPRRHEAKLSLDHVKDLPWNRSAGTFSEGATTYTLSCDAAETGFTPPYQMDAWP